jgi:hypothetical protein
MLGVIFMALNVMLIEDGLSMWSDSGQRCLSCKGHAVSDKM